MKTISFKMNNIWTIVLAICLTVGAPIGWSAHAAVGSVRRGNVDLLDRLVKINIGETFCTVYSYDQSGNRTRKATKHTPTHDRTPFLVGQFMGGVELLLERSKIARVSLYIVNSGAFTASIEIGSRRIPWKGVFTTNGSGAGTWVGTVNDAVLGLLELRLELPPDGGVMTVFLTHNERTNTGLLVLAGQRGGGNVGAGFYTVLLPANPDFPEDDYPQGDGYATLRVTAKGQARLAGKLGDGTTMTQSGPLTHDGRFQVFVPLYKRAGVLSGWVDFTPVSQISDFNGTLHWTKPESPSEAFYPAGFHLALDVLGSKFVPPLNGRRVLNFNDNGGQGVLGFSRGNLTDVLLNDLVLATNNRVSFSTAGPVAPIVSIGPTRGLIAGSFLHPVIGKRVPFAGVVFQKQSIASGHFKGTNQTGLAVLQKDLFSGLELPSAMSVKPGNEITNAPISSQSWSDDFNGGALDTSKWSILNSAGVSVSGGLLYLTRSTSWGGYVTTREKITYQKSKYVVEYRARRTSNFDVIFAFSDGTNEIGILDSSYSTNVGLMLYRNGIFGIRSQFNGQTTTQWKEYRITIDGQAVTVQRGDSLSNLTETLTDTLEAPISTVPLHFLVGATGGSTTEMDWIRVTAQ